ncbi:MAG: hypothetical protein C4B58_04185 [Deltaproteobacteria bacterium]|nr:MAG: hypothetical protein C4B58_04185 [Deltaproteobacteria bacterium]
MRVWHRPHSSGFKGSASDSDVYTEEISFSAPGSEGAFATQPIKLRPNPRIARARVMYIKCFVDIFLLKSIL